MHNVCVGLQAQLQRGQRLLPCGPLYRPPRLHGTCPTHLPGGWLSVPRSRSPAQRLQRTCLMEAFTNTSCADNYLIRPVANTHEVVWLCLHRANWMKWSVSPRSGFFLELSRFRKVAWIHFQLLASELVPLCHSLQGNTIQLHGYYCNYLCLGGLPKRSSVHFSTIVRNTFIQCVLYNIYT